MKALPVAVLLISLAVSAEACTEAAQPDGYAAGIVTRIGFSEGQATYRLRLLESDPALPDSFADFVTPIVVSADTFVHPGTGKPRHFVARREVTFSRFSLTTIGLDLGMPVLVTYYIIPGGSRAIAQRYLLRDDELAAELAPSAFSDSAEAAELTKRACSIPPARWSFSLVDPGPWDEIILARAEGALCHPESKSGWMVAERWRRGEGTGLSDFRASWSAVRRGPGGR